MGTKKQGQPRALRSLLDSIGETNSDHQAEIIKKVKRCYTITDDQLEKVLTLKAKDYREKDLSEIVGMAIDILYEIRHPEE